MTLTRQHKAYLFALSAVLLWSTVATAFKISLRYLDVFQLLLVASVTATLCLLLVVLVTGRLPLLSSTGKRDYLRLACLGVLNPFCYYLVLFRAYDLLPAQVAQALNYTWAITLMLLSVPILKHRITRFDCIATVTCYAGVVVICFSGGQFPGGELKYGGYPACAGQYAYLGVLLAAQDKRPYRPRTRLVRQLPVQHPVYRGGLLVRLRPVFPWDERHPGRGLRGAV